MDSKGLMVKPKTPFECKCDVLLHNGALLVAFLSHGLVGFKIVELHGVDRTTSVKSNVEP